MKNAKIICIKNARLLACDVDGYIRLGWRGDCCMVFWILNHFVHKIYCPCTKQELWEQLQCDSAKETTIVQCSV